MKVLMINVVCGTRSTGRICTDLASALEAQGHEVKIAYGRGNVPVQFQKYAVRIGRDLDVKLHGVKARLFDGAGFGSKQATVKFIQWVQKYDPDIIHLHNIHGYYINVQVLFDYLRTCGKKIIWTLHDCWSFTGHCAYFDYVGCNKWKEECYNCQQRKEYPAGIFLECSKKNYQTKKLLFSSIPDLCLVVPSKWLANLVAESFLCEYPVKVIHNGIDTRVFKPVHSNVFEEYGVADKKIVLGVAAVWDNRKGLNTFIQLAEKLDERYKIVLAGLSKRQVKKLPKNIIGITKTDSVQELVAIYSMADVFVNPTLEDNYPTVNLEARACGTPVITYMTGGSPESAGENGIVVKQGDMDALITAIRKIKEKPSVIETENLDNQITLAKYVDIYLNETTEGK